MSVTESIVICGHSNESVQVKGGGEEGYKDCRCAAAAVQEQRAGEESAATDRAKNNHYTLLPLQDELSFKFISISLQQTNTWLGLRRDKVVCDPAAWKTGLHSMFVQHLSLCCSAL